MHDPLDGSMSPASPGETSRADEGTAQRPDLEDLAREVERLGLELARLSALLDSRAAQGPSPTPATPASSVPAPRAPGTPPGPAPQQAHLSPQQANPAPQQQANPWMQPPEPVFPGATGPQASPNAPLPATAPTDSTRRASLPSSPPTGKASESRLGAYTLSIASALLIFFAGASLIALFWNSIPDAAKVGFVGFLALVLTVTGTVLSQMPGEESGDWRRSVPTATLLGMGGGLGFVAIIGAAILGVLVNALSGLLLLIAWGIIMYALGALTRNPFTWIIAALGGISTIELVVFYADREPASAHLAAIALLIHLLILTGITFRSSPIRTSAASRPASFLPVLALALWALLRLPIDTVPQSKAPLTLAVYSLFGVLLLMQALLLTRAAEEGQHRREWSLIWIAIPLLLGGTALRISAWEVGPASFPAAIDSAPLIAFAAVLLLLIGILLCSFLSAAFPMHPVPRAAAAHGLSAAVLLILIARASLGERSLLEIAAMVLVLAATAIPAVIAGRGGHALTLPFMSLPFLLPLFGRDWASEGAGIVLLVVIMTASLLVDVFARRTRRAAQTLASPPDSLPRAAAWAQGIVLLVHMTAAVQGALFLLEIAGAWRTTAMWICLFSALGLLILSGLPSNALGPAELFSGEGFGARVSPRVLPAVAPSPTVAAGAGPGAPRPMTQPAPGAPAGIAAQPGLALPAAHPGPAARLRAPVAPILITGAVCLLIVVSAVIDAFSSRSGSLDVHTGVLAALTVVLASISAWMLRPVAALDAGGSALGAVIIIPTVTTLTMLAPEGARSWISNIALVLAAALCILIGLALRARRLRFLGLVTVLVGVLKIALVDLAAQNSLTRIGALFLAGLICFLLSLAYTRLFTAFDEERDRPRRTPQPMPSPQPMPAPELQSPSQGLGAPPSAPERPAAPPPGPPRDPSLS